MATINAAGAGNWSAGATWTGGVVPGNGDTAALGNFAIVMDIATIPAAGNLTGITAGTGQLTIDMSATGLNGNATINAAGADLQAGTNNTGLIYLSVASTNTLTINGNLLGGAGSTDYCINIVTASNHCHVVINGNLTGGGGVLANAFTSAVSGYAGNITITGSVTGGTGSNACGLYLPNSYAGAITLNSCNLIDGSGGVAVFSPKPATWNLGTTNYYQNAAGTKFYYDVPAIGNVTEDDTLAGVTGTYHEATEAEVQSGVAFGASSALTGTYSGGDGVNMPRTRIGH